MRNQALIGWTGIMLLAGCGSGTGNVTQTPAEDPPVLLKAGEWTITRTLTGYDHPGITAAEYGAKVGTKTETKSCIAIDKDGRPQADKLAGVDGHDCMFKDTQIRNGRFIAKLVCKAVGASKATIMLEGNYTSDSMTLGYSMTRTLNGKAVLRTSSDFTGQRMSDCSDTE